ncbi:MAG: serine/threonine-protein kinase [Elainellaceae cyanobacterium]
MTAQDFNHSAIEMLAERYQIQQQLGKKAGRRTLLALDLNTQEQVVIKLLLFGHDFEWDALKLFEREAAILQTLSHPAIPRYLDYFETDTAYGKGFALVQSYIPARSLESTLKTGQTFSETEVRQLAIALLEILIYLHGRQPPVIHRDIKPSNILIGDRSGNYVGQIYLVDFGSVQTLAAREGGTITVVGTYGYMPPEQFGGRAVPASDLYSLGATLIFLLTGQHPADFPQDNLRLQFEQAVSLHPAFAHWLKRMIEPSLDRRFRSAEQALAALDQQNQETQLLFYPQQPVGSLVKLQKNADVFEIQLPPLGFRPATAALLLFAIAWNTFIVFWTFSAFSAPFPFSLIFCLFSLPFWGVGLTMIGGILASLFGVTRLQITPQQISFTYNVLGVVRKLTPASLRHDITQLEYVARPDHIRPAEEAGIHTSGTLRIWAGARRYELSDQRLTKPELEWLAQELSEWLGLPIDRT